MQEEYLFEDKGEQRPQFANDFEYYLAMLGCLAGYGSFWRFSYLFYQHGGSVFLIPYLIFMLLLGAPILHLETLLGQLGQATSIRLFDRLHPRLKGLGVFPVIVSLCVCAYYNSLLVYSWIFFFQSFKSPLPWTIDRSPGDVLNEKYFTYKILHLTPSAAELGDFQPYIFLVYIFSVLLCILAIIKGVQVSGKITLITATLPYLLFVVLLLRGLFLQGASQAILDLLTPKLIHLFQPTIWRDAAVQVFFQLGTGSGIPIMFSSFRRSSSKMGNYTWLFCIGVTVCGLLSVVIVYIYMHHFTIRYGLSFEQLVVSGPSLAFVVFSQALSLLPWPNLWSILFYLTLILLGVDSEFGFIETVAASFEDIIPDFHKGQDKQRVRRWIGGGLCSCSLLFSFGNGFHMVTLVDSFNYNLPVPFICLMETYLVGRDFQPVEKKLKKLTGQTTPPFLLHSITGASLKYLLLGVLGVGVVEQVSYSMELGMVLNLVGWSITMAPFGVAVYFWKQTSSTLEISVERMIGGKEDTF